MRVLVLANNWLGWQVVTWLRAQGVELVGLVLHPEPKRRFGPETLAAAGVPERALFLGDTLRQPAVLDQIKALGAELALSVLFDHILAPPFLQLFERGVVNLHPALLPYNRGQYPNVWSILEGTPSGTTLHYIDEGIDTGAIIAQRAVSVAPEDTGESLYRKLEGASLRLFQETWPALAAGQITVVEQPVTGGTTHRSADVNAVDEIDLDRSYRARDLINLLRARTFPPYKGAYFRDGGDRIYLRLALDREGND